jgi:uncharacterized protein YllA (UPF0747 family)
MTVEEIKDKRTHIEQKNRQLRKEIGRFRSQIKALERKIEIEKWAIQHHFNLINKNQENYIELGKLLNQKP